MRGALFVRNPLTRAAGSIPKPLLLIVVSREGGGGTVPGT